MAYGSIKARKGSDYTPVPTGLHLGICFQIVGLGNQEFKGNVTPRVWIGFELPDVLIKGKPMTIGKEYALFVGGKSKLGEMLKSWRGKPFTDEEMEAFEVTSIAGKIGQVNVTAKESDRSKTEIGLVLGLIQAQKDLVKSGKIKTTPVNDIVVYSPDDHDEAMWQKVPEFLKRKINERVVEEKDSVETAAPAADQGFDDSLDDVPF